MNKVQKVVLGIGLAVFIVTLFCVPVTVTYHLSEGTSSYAKISTIFTPDPYAKVRFDMLGMEWAAIALVTGFLCFVLKTRTA